MRAQHRDKRDLVTEVTELRKQIADLKQAATERRRVEDGLRHDRELLHALLDQAPHPLCLLTREGVPLLAHQPFVDLLGYATRGELVRIGADLGLLLGDPEISARPMPPQPRDLTFRRSEGGGLIAPTISSPVPGADCLALTVLTTRQQA